MGDVYKLSPALVDELDFSNDTDYRGTSLNEDLGRTMEIIVMVGLGVQDFSNGLCDLVKKWVILKGSVGELYPDGVEEAFCTGKVEVKGQSKEVERLIA